MTDAFTCAIITLVKNITKLKRTDKRGTPLYQVGGTTLPEDELIRRGIIRLEKPDSAGRRPARVGHSGEADGNYWISHGKRDPLVVDSD